jgi:multiple sugar transport system substrate-binding protein
LDSVKAGLAFAAGEIAMMVNWFGFAALAHTWEESKVRGKVEIAPIPHGPGGRSVSLNVYWILSIAAGTPHRDVAWRFLQHCMNAGMDKLTTMEGAIGCRKSTWFDEQVNRAIPFYHRMAELHRVAREIPLMRRWPKIAAIIDELITATVNSNVPVEELLAAADRKTASLELNA